MVELLTNRWERGLSGWLTMAEAISVGLALTMGARELGLAAAAEVQVLDDRRPYLIYSGGRYGQHRLALTVTGPVLARLHWTAYLSSCSPLVPASPGPSHLQLVGGGR